MLFIIQDLHLIHHIFIKEPDRIMYETTKL